MLRAKYFLPTLALPVFSMLMIGETSTVALGDSFQKIDPSVIRFCVNQLLYDHTFPDGTPAGDRTILDPASAALACHGVLTQEEALSVRRCINGLLYDEIFSNGNPVGDRTIIDPASAARACSSCKNYS